MKLDFATYLDKVKGCWAGKNIGGVLGAPFEGKRQYNDIDFYTQDLTMGPPPNDDLDLQIVWLAAVERYGRQVDASILGDYWLSYIIPNWVEYGMGKANLRAGLVPPMSGAVDNDYKDSCGCFIRSELWACLAPGNPALAVRYAYEDAIVDHADDGVQSEIFCAALQSAAFVESDPYRLIDIALSYIPAQGGVAKAVKAAMDCKAENLPYKEAIARLHDAVPGTFGVQNVTLKEGMAQTQAMGMKEFGRPGWDAPENVGYVILSWLYGEDFGDRLCKAVACGEDTDCTCATLGALLGIISGAAALPSRWTEPINDKIATLCIDKTSQGVWVPDTVTQLTQRILRVTPGFLGADKCDLLAPGGYTIDCQEGDGLYCPVSDDYMARMNGSNKNHAPSVRELATRSSYVLRKEYPAFNVEVDLGEDAYFEQGKARSIRVKVKNAFEMRQQQWARITLYAPEGVAVLGGRQVMLPLNNLWDASAQAEFQIDADLYAGGRLELLLDVQLEGRHSYGCLKIVLMRKRAVAPAL